MHDPPPTSVKASSVRINLTAKFTFRHNVSGLRVQLEYWDTVEWYWHVRWDPGPAGDIVDAKMQRLKILPRFQRAFEFPTEAGTQTTE